MMITPQRGALMPIFSIRNMRTPSKKKDPAVRRQVHLFYGDEFLVKEQLNKFINESVEPSLRETNVMFHDGNNFDVSALASDVFTVSLFGGPRAVVLENTVLFLSKMDGGKIISKAMDHWKTGDGKAALKSFRQFVSLNRLNAGDLESGSDWISDTVGDAVASGEREILSRLAQTYLEEGKQAPSQADEAVLEMVRSPLPEDAVLVFTAPGVDKRSKLFKAVEEKGSVLECAVKAEKYGAGMDRAFFDKRVRDALKKAGKEAGPSVLESIYSKCGKDLRRLEIELEKLFSFVGQRKKIEPADVQNVFSDFHEPAFFDMVKTLRSGDLGKSLVALHENLKISGHPLQSLGAIITEFRRLIIAREMLFTTFKQYWKPGLSYDAFMSAARKVREAHPELITKSKNSLLSMKDYPLFLYLRDAQKFPMEKLLKIMEELLAADIMMKSSRLGARNPQAILERVVHVICAKETGISRR